MVSENNILRKIKVGDKFGYWTVLDVSLAKYENGYHILCQCICGSIKNVMRRHLRSGRSKSCDCHGRDKNLCKICNKFKYGNHSTYCNDCYTKYQRIWYSNNREKERIRCSIYAKANKDKIAEDRRLWRIKNYEHWIKYTTMYRKNNKDRISLHARNKRAKRRTSIGSDVIELDQWILLKNYYNNKCFYCEIHVDNLTMDHYIPLSRGGKHILSNIVPACRKCNNRKTYLMPDVFIRRINNEK